MVDVDAGADHPPDIVDMAAFAGRDHRDAAEPVAQGQVRIRRQQRLEHRDAAGDAGDQPCAVLLIVLRVRVGTEDDQKPCHVEVVGGRGQQQGGSATVVAGLDRRRRPGARPPPDRHHLGGRLQQRGGAAAGSVGAASIAACRVQR